jgi:hypothetical protein
VDSDTQSQSGLPQVKTQGRWFDSNGLAEAQAGAIPARRTVQHNHTGEKQVSKLDFSRPENLKRRDEGEFRILATDVPGDEPIAVLYKFANKEEWFIDTIPESGAYFGNQEGRESPYDIIPKPARVTGWVNVYQTMNPGSPFWLWDTKEKAAEKAGKHCIGQIYIDAEVQ